jgi:hypothetical protein
VLAQRLDQNVRHRNIALAGLGLRRLEADAERPGSKSTRFQRSASASPSLMPVNSATIATVPSRQSRSLSVKADTSRTITISSSATFGGDCSFVTLRLIRLFLAASRRALPSTLCA